MAMRTVVDTLSLLPPVAIAGQLVVAIHAQVPPQCEIVSTEAKADPSEFVVRTNCNLEQYELHIEAPPGSAIASATAQNAIALVMGDGSIRVKVSSPTIQTLHISLTGPASAGPPVVFLRKT